MSHSISYLLLSATILISKTKFILFNKDPIGSTTNCFFKTNRTGSTALHYRTDCLPVHPVTLSHRLSTRPSRYTIAPIVYPSIPLHYRTDCLPVHPVTLSHRLSTRPSRYTIAPIVYPSIPLHYRTDCLPVHPVTLSHRLSTRPSRYTIAPIVYPSIPLHYRTDCLPVHPVTLSHRLPTRPSFVWDVTGEEAPSSPLNALHTELH